MQDEKTGLLEKRRNVFDTLEIPCELKYEFEDGGTMRKCYFFLEFEGKKHIYVEAFVLDNEEPHRLYIEMIPDAYRNDFLMLWKKAHEEEVIHEAIEKEKYYRSQQNKTVIQYTETERNYLKKFYYTLAKQYHPDNVHDNGEAMQYVNDLKEMWGI